MTTERFAEYRQSTPLITYLIYGICGLTLLALLCQFMYTPFWLITVRWVEPWEWEEYQEDPLMDTYPLIHCEALDLRWGREVFILTQPRTVHWGALWKPPAVTYEELQRYPLFQRYPQEAFEFQARFDWTVPARYLFKIAFLGALWLLCEKLSYPT